MLGSALVPALLRAGLDVHATDLSPEGSPGLLPGGLERLDVRVAHDLRRCLNQAEPDIVFHLAAETDLETCERDPDGAFATNAIATKNVALACEVLGVPIVYISTAGVFDGTKEDPYTEFDSPNPINVYGKSKLAGERFVEMLSSRYFIVRAGWMIGGGNGKDHKFVAKILDQITAGATTIYAVTDKLGTPTYTHDFANCLGGVVASSRYGLYHMASVGRGSRYDVAAEILVNTGRSDIRLEAVQSDYFARDFPAPRPRSEMMRNMVLELEGANTMRPWREALRAYLIDYFDPRNSDTTTS
jgi:dTDP-4-dehydrorhamnose reductase